MLSMNILCLGLNHRTAPVELRERLTASLAHVVACLPQNTAVQELALLSTCNRLELYATLPPQEPGAAVLLSLLAQTNGLEPAMLVDHVYFYKADTAVHHLLRVAAGLDSLVLGEPQILGQVAAAHQTAVTAGTAGPVLDTLFKAAVRAGKRARAETKISSNPASVTSVAIALAQQKIGRSSNSRYLVVGAGEMGRLAVKALRYRGLHHIAVANRTVTRAQALTAAWAGPAYGFEALPQAIAAADVVLTAVHAPAPIIDITEIWPRERPLILIDLAVPRNVATAVARLPHVLLFDMDDLQTTLDESLAARQIELPGVEAIIAQEAGVLQRQFQELTIKPLIVDMRRKAEEIRQHEWDRTLKHLDELDPQTLAHIQHFSRSLVNKLLHEPTLRLKAKAADNQASEYAAAVRHLFGLVE